MFLNSFQANRDLKLLTIYPIDICISGVVNWYFFTTETGEECPCVMHLENHKHNFNVFLECVSSLIEARRALPHTIISTEPTSLPNIHTHHFNIATYMLRGLPWIF